MSESQSTTLDKVVVCGTAFACSCATFALSVLVVIPLAATLMSALDMPDIVQQMVVLLALFALPIFGAFWGISVGLGIIQSNQDHLGRSEGESDFSLKTLR